MQKLNGTPSAPDILDRVRKQDPDVTTVSETLRKAALDDLVRRLEDRDEDGFAKWRLTGKGKKWKPHKPGGATVPDPEQYGPDRYPEHLRAMPAANTGSYSIAQMTRTAEEQYKVLEAIRDLGKGIAGTVQDQMGFDREDKIVKSRLGKQIRLLIEAGLVADTGELVWAPWQLEAKQRGEVHIGRKNREFALTEKGREALGVTPEEGEAEKPEPPAEPEATGPPVLEEASPTLEEVRDVVTQLDGMMFSPAQVLMYATEQRGGGEVNWDMGLLTARLDTLLERDVLKNRSPSDDLKLYLYERPYGPGKAAEIDSQRTGNGEAEPTGGAPVAGTGRQLAVKNPEVRKLVEQAKAAGCQVQPAGSGHLAVMTPSGRRVMISSTPSRARSVENDRTRLRRVGVRV